MFGVESTGHDQSQNLSLHAGPVHVDQGTLVGFDAVLLDINMLGLAGIEACASCSCRWLFKKGLGPCRFVVAGLRIGEHLTNLVVRCYASGVTLEGMREFPFICLSLSMGRRLRCYKAEYWDKNGSVHSRHIERARHPKCR